MRPEFIKWLDAEDANILTVLDWHIEYNNWAASVLLARLLSGYWYILGFQQEGLQRVARVVSTPTEGRLSGPWAQLC